MALPCLVVSLPIDGAETIGDSERLTLLLLHDCIFMAWKLPVGQ
jgi:hypothetical protein